MINLAGKLKHKVDVYVRVPFIDDVGATDYKYEKIKSIWCMITPIQNGRTIKTDNTGMTKVSETIKFTMRINSIAIKPDMYFIYKKQRYDVDYAMPFFKTIDIQEVYTKLTIENDTNAGEQIYGY